MSTSLQLPNNTEKVSAPQSDQTLVYLVRHAQTGWNLERRFQGQLDVPLDDAGMTQAASVADWLINQNLHFTAVYTSDLSRALQTAQAIGERLGLVARPVPALREIHGGEWQGLLPAEIEERYPGQLERWHREPHEFRLPGGETVPEVQARVTAWYRDTVEAHPGEAIVVVSHGLAIRTLLAALNGWDLADAEAMKAAGMGNTGVAVMLAHHDSGHTSMLRLNSLGHLEDAASGEATGERSNEPATV
jgi:probable phosphoglycerate mutase